ncbi:hypothetical protein HDU88_007658 [Geranomyces variabilis]|nr:hypothetical protein HDU88_007658 [Geranomyces variabilis]
MAGQAATPSDYDPSSAIIPSICSHCGLSIDGQFVRALNGHYHLDCFRCQDCQQVVAEKFFPLPGPDGQKHFFCEKDYFRRLDLLCAKCGGALRGAHIDALGKKYHLEHFTCTVCPTVFRQHDSYYEQEGNVYCQLHYSFLFAAKCGGCKTAVLKSFVETNKGSTVEKWHPECYMIYKLWNVTLDSSTTQVSDVMPPKVDKAEVAAHQAIAEKASRILHVLSVYEESSAECISSISEMLIRFSHEKRQEGVVQAATFVSHIAALFLVIDDIELKLVSFGDGTGLQHSKEPKQLTKKIVHFFSLLSYVQQDPEENRQEATKEMISVVTSLAHTLKILIRAALNGALKLEREHNIDTAVLDFLDRLASSEWQTGQSRVIDDCGPGETPELCTQCGQSVEEECVSYEYRRWHASCLRCAVDGQDLRSLVHEATFDPASDKCYCGKHSPEGARKGFKRVTQLEQYIFLLRAALKRLCALLNIDFNTLSQLDAADSTVSSSGDVSATRESAVSESRDPSVIASSNEQLIYMDAMENMDPRVRPGGGLNASSPAPRNGVDRDGVRNGGAVDQDTPSLLDLSGLDHWAVRQLAAQALHPLVADHFTLSELMDVACARKQSVWGRMVEALRKPAKTKEGTFGVSLEVLVERHGIDTDLGPRPGQLRIPVLLDSCIKALHGMDLTVEGIFRKNGNIRNLKTISDDIDRDPQSVDLTDNHSVQVAALLKKFLRDMPEPLLTFKLHKLFVRTQVMSGTARRKEALHYVCCMLPKPNLDFLSVLAYFLRHVADFAEIDDHGNKMGLDNLATVITPNVLYSKSKNAADDENVLAIEAVKMILMYQDELWVLPQVISERLKTDTTGERSSSSRNGHDNGAHSATSGGIPSRSFSVSKRSGDDSVPARNVIVTPTSAGQGTGVATRIETAGVGGPDRR